MAIDYGGKRTGIAVTDPLRIIATGLTTVDTIQLFPFLKKYFSEETVDEVVLGEPMNLDGTDTHASPLVRTFSKRFKKEFPAVILTMHDERFTSKMALQSMLISGQKKKVRRDKRNLDMISATILLQDYLEHNKL